MTRALIASTIVALCMVGCSADDSNPGELAGQPQPDPGADPGANPGAPPAISGTAVLHPPLPAACGEATPHVGFGMTDFVADRKPGDIGTNRRRVKPYSALGTEFKRALGVVPAGLAGSLAAYGDTPARWFSEPAEGAVSLYTTYSLAFTTCYDTMTAAPYATAPTATTAPAECAKLARKYWQRAPGADETKACSDLILGLATETNPRRQWAHGCASLLTSTGFTTY